jgi:hypothetical protein
MAHLPIELVELIYKQLIQNRIRARETIRKHLLYKGWAPGSAFGASRIINMARGQRQSDAQH